MNSDKENLIGGLVIATILIIFDVAGSYYWSWLKLIPGSIFVGFLIYFHFFKKEEY